MCLDVSKRQTLLKLFTGKCLLVTIAAGATAAICKASSSARHPLRPVRDPMNVSRSTPAQCGKENGMVS